MPSVMLEVPETYDSITRPITTEVVRDLIERLALPNNTGILYQGNAEVSAQRGSILARKRDDVTFPFTGRVKVDLTENYLENNTLTTTTRSLDNPPVFHDSHLGVSIRPIYTRTESVVSFSYRAPDANTAMRWRDHLRRKSSEGMQALLHELNYHYSVPEPFLELLHEIYQKREAVMGFGDSYNDYLLNHFTKRLTTLANMDASRVLGAIAEKQIEVQGWLDFPDQPDQPDKSREGETWDVSFTYTFHYDKVTAMVIHYPIVVHNQLIDERFIDLSKVPTPYDASKRLTSRSGGALDGFRLTQHDLTRKGVAAVTIPPYDDWAPVGVGHRTLDVITTLIGVDFDDPTLIVDLKDLGEASFEQDVIDFLKAGHNLLNVYLGLPFLVTFFRGDSMVSPDDYYVDADLVVRSYEPLNPRDVHHMRFSVLYDLRNLSIIGRQLILQHPSVARKVVDLIYLWDQPYAGSAQPFAPKGRHLYGRSHKLKRPIHPGFTTGPNPHIKPRPGQWVPGRDGTVQPGGVGGGPLGPGSQSGDDYSGMPSEWLKVSGNGTVTQRSWDTVAGNFIYQRYNDQRNGVMQTVMQAGIIAHSKHR